MQDWASDFYHSAKWLATRKAYISQRVAVDGGLCERCQRRAGKIVHHKKYLTENNVNDSAVTLNQDNLELLCQKCHNIEHISQVKRSITLECKFDEYGYPLPPI